jgi:hypothetical protein
MPGISDLLDTYDQSGGNKDGSRVSGNSIITQQINYINALQTYLNTVNNAVNGNCISGDYRTMSFEELKGNCSTSTGTDICKSICTHLTSQSDAIIRPIGGTMGAQYITFANDFSLANNPKVNGEYGNVIANSEKIQKLRSELDMKLKDLNKTPDSRFREYEDKYNYELMMNITWSILATSIIYFVFVKL